jgi:prophage regulatory protein
MSADPQITSSRRLMRLPAVLALVGLGRSRVYELMAEGRFPAPVKLSQRAIAWPSDEVDAWIAFRIEARDTAEVTP